MADFVVVIVLAIVITGAVRYIYKEKKRGAKCIGCAAGKQGCGCSCDSVGNNGTDVCCGCSKHEP